MSHSIQNETDSKVPIRQQNITAVLPVFPLPMLLLPGGKQRLRIFEQKYLTMVARASQGTGFVITTIPSAAEQSSSVDKAQGMAEPFSSQESLNASWGTKVNIVDFNMGEDQILEIDVEGEHIVEINQLRQENNLLLIADTRPLNHWPESDIPLPPIFSQFLRQLFTDNPYFTTLYSAPQFDSPQWVCARILELMPIPVERKKPFVSPTSFPALIPFLEQIINGK